MAALADTIEIHRQQCIDVLCGYLRLPYDPTNPLLTTVVSEHTWPVGGAGAGGKETRTWEQLPKDREVRLTIISTITRHLRDDAEVSWQGRSLDFTGAVFDGGDFSEATFSASVSFAGARFTAGGDVTFSGAKFSVTPDFQKATFAGTVFFSNATFSSYSLNFMNARFSNGLVSFRDAHFAGRRVDFMAAHFSGSLVTFDRAHLADSRVDFLVAAFSGGKVDFAGAHFAGSRVDFSRAFFFGGEVSFDNAPDGELEIVGAEFRPKGGAGVPRGDDRSPHD